MKIMKKVMLSMFFMLTIFVSLSFSVDAVDMVPIPKWGGGNITYRGTNVQMKMPAEYIEPEANFRAVWVSNVVNDISTYANEAQYKAEMLRVFDTMEYYNMNALIFHVRTHHDAMYKSKINRLSPNYTGVNFDEFDPLEWIIEESKKRGIEFHAWMNPYRIGAGSIEQVAARFSGNNPAAKTENLLKGAQNVILDPGRPAVRDFLVETVLEVIENYDIDAIHFDDYFYESGVDDSDTRAIYNTGLSVADFRREQVDLFIKDLNEAISFHNQRNNKHVQLGISPSGIYRNGSYVPLSNYRYNEDGSLQYPLASNSAGFAHYDAYLYADTLKWINNKWIDYIVPQVYWSFDHTVAPFGDIVEWWNAALKNSKVNLYIGTALYTAGAASSNGWTHDPREFANEVQFASGLSNVHGQVIFSFTQLHTSLKSTTGLFYQNMHNVKNEMWYKDALLPEIRTLNPVNLSAVKNFKLSTTSAGYRLDFDGIDEARTYAIYRSTSPLTYDVSELVKVIGKKEIDGKISYIDEVSTNKTYYYGVKAFSKTNTPGEAVSLSTNTATAGELIPVGKFPEIQISETAFYNERVTLSWNEIIANFGDTVEYTVYTSKNNKDFVKSNTPITKNGRVFSTNIMLDEDEKLYFYLNAKNKISNQNSEIYEIDIKNNIGPIRNFTVSGATVAGGLVDFKWNTVSTNEEVTYTVQTSSNQSSWRDLVGEVVIDNKLAKFAYTLPNNYSNNYYRVVATSENGRAISDVINITAFEEIEGFKLKYNDKPIDGPIYINANDVIELSWDNLSHVSGEINYRTNMSHNYKDWKFARIYDQKNSLKTYPGKTAQVINAGFEYFVLYVQVEATTATARAVSEIVEIRITPALMLPRIVFDNYYYQHEALINRSGIFK